MGRQRSVLPPLLLPAAVAAFALLAPRSSPARSEPDSTAAPTAIAAASPALAIHGGAGTLRREEIGPALEAEIRAALAQALATGWEVLAGGGGAADAAVAAVTILEDSPHFNAGKGAVFTSAGTHEMDAAVMDGASGRAGAVAGATRVKNPIAAARAVMETTPHVLLAGPAVEALAAAAGLALVPPSYFFTQRRFEQHRRGLAERGEAAGSGHGPGGLGTVGAVARDRSGHLAAATSTGGLTNKRPGRIGDTPLIGAGTYADRACAVSGTGDGESFIRHVVAHDLCARAAYRATPLAEAAGQILREVLAPEGADAGLIALGATGGPVLDFNTPGMYRGSIGPDGTARVAIFAEEP